MCQNTSAPLNNVVAPFLLQGEVFKNMQEIQLPWGSDHSNVP
jgi:hypothetical protein